MDTTAPGTGSISGELPAGEAAVRVRGLRKTYGGATAVDGIDLEIARGETFALLGPNGAGKTTTVEILEGYRAATGGDVAVLGVDPRRAASTGRRGSASCCSPPASRGNATVREQLRHFAGFYPNPRDVDEVIAAVGLEEKAEDAHPQALGRAAAAGGCRARHHRPARAALPRRADDGVRPRGAPRVLGPHPPLKAEGTTILLTTHYLDEAAQLADRVGVIADGALVAIGADRRARRAEARGCRSCAGRRTGAARGAHRATRPSSPASPPARW